ncbi:hypothetical protein DENSPDRAFT_814932 [Dentipellis sp. KUC8613]|nr:hypothetical protein DENSPDRAFT_814932 [Dentipellis sp. KUC8613]
MRSGATAGFFSAWLAVCVTVVLLFLWCSQPVLECAALRYGADQVGFAASVYVTEILITIGFIVFLHSPFHLPFDRLLLGPFRYHRTHASHMRLDRLRRLAVRYCSPTRTELARHSFPYHDTPAFVQRDALHGVSCKNSDLPHQLIPRYRLLGGAPHGAAALPAGIVHLSDSSDDDEPGQFNSAEWIGHGLSWNDDLPRCVKRARNAARTIPASVLDAMIPDSSLMVTEVLSQISDLSQRSAASDIARYLPDAPNVLTNDPSDPEFHPFLANLCRPHLINSVHLVSQLRSSFDSAWLSGAGSVHLPSAPHYRWPLWTERLLGDIQIAVDKMQKWTAASKWLARVETSTPADVAAELVHACRERFADIPWNSTVPGLGHAVVLTTSHLSYFLSDRWLDDEMINAGLSHIVQSFEETSRVRLANCFFLPALRNLHARSAGSIYNSRLSSTLDRDLSAGRVDILEIPVNPGGHWTGIKVDLVNRTFAYRDGANPNATVTPEMCELVTWYLQAVLGKTDNWTVIPPIQCPRQVDSFSCGIAYLSTLGADYVGYDRWTQEHFALHRMQWFIRLSERLVDRTSPATTASPVLGMDDPATSLAHGLSLDNVELHLHDDSLAHSSIPSSSSSPGLLECLDEWLVVSRPASPPTCSFSIETPSATTLTTSSKRDRDVPDAALDSSSKQFNAGNHSGNSDCTFSDSDAPDSDGSFVRIKRQRLSHPRMSTQSSWAQQKSLKASSRNVDFRANSQSLDRFRNKVLAEDPHAEFKSHDLCAVRCSACATWIQMRVLYDLKRWKEHRTSAKCTKQRSKGLITKSLQSFFSPKTTPSTAFTKAGAGSPLQGTVETSKVPCSGLTRDANRLVDKYLRRTAVDGGGAPSRECIAVQLFHRESRLCRWSALTYAERMKVTRREQQLYKWLNKHSLGAVFSTKCAGQASPSPSIPDYAPCTQCLHLLHLHTFQNALNVPLPLDKNTKFTPKQYRSSALGDLYLRHQGLQELVEANDGQTPWLRFAKGAVSGKFKTQGTILAMVEAMMIKADRLRKGKSLRNMHYSEGLDAFSTYLASISCRAYLAFQRVFGGRSLRSIRHLQTKQPRFEPDIAAGNITRAVKILRDLKYSGPLGLSWDDTDLEKALTIRQEASNVWLLLGASRGTIRVTSVEDVESILGDAKLEKADKLRIWVLTIPLPRIPPILLAAVARGSKDSAESLAELHMHLLQLLHNEGIYPVSYAADGTEVERSLQRLITTSRTSSYAFSIPNNVPGCRLDYLVPLFDHRPSVAVQDSKHGGKTARNQLLSGARALALGNHTINYKQVRNLSQHPMGSLFVRDVERLDRQDDRAAQRLLSSEALSCVLKYFCPESNGLGVYLFVLGELYDAWQNRNLDHATRANMVIRARFFLMAWRSHIEAHPHHRTHIHFISHESFDIFLRLCDSLIELIAVYRRFYPTYPLLPWLHSTEVCEHIFGMLRQLKKDFNYSDMLYLEPKLRSLMLGAFQGLSPEEKANQTAAGYHHTYYHAPDLDLAALMSWPSDEDFADASKHAFEEVEQLLSVVGINAKDILAKYREPHPSSAPVKQVHAPTKMPHSIVDMLALYVNDSFKSSVEDEMETCEMALAAEAADKTVTIMSLPDTSHVDEESIRELVAEYSKQIARISTTLPPESVANRLSSAGSQSVALLTQPQLTSFTFSNDSLVSIRRKHQPISTSKAVRQVARLKDLTEFSETHLTSKTTHSASEASNDMSVRDALLRHIAVLSASPDSLLTTQSTTSGVNRQVRHTGIYALGNTSTSVRAEQKATLLEVSSSKFMHHRATAFAVLQDIHENMHNGNITSLCPLRSGHFVAALRPDTKDSVPEIVLAEVVTMYTTTGARGAKHDWTASVTSVGSSSYIVGRVFTPSYMHTYSSLSCAALGCATFLRIPRTHVMFSFASASSDIRAVDMVVDPNHPFHYITLGSFPTHILKALEQRSSDIFNCIQALIKLESQRQSIPDPSSSISTSLPDQSPDSPHVRDCKGSVA